MLRRRLLQDSGVDYSQMYLTFEAIESGTFKATKETQYSLDDGATWVSLSENCNSPTISGGSKIMFKATSEPSISNYITFIGNAKHNVMGNPYSLIYGDNFKGVTSLSSSYALSSLFRGNENLVNAKNLSLPATRLTNYCYSSMFQGCTSLTTAPELPATRLANRCYYSMFRDCTSLTTAPSELPATRLTNYCYSSMFQGCTSLTTAPELPATTLERGCYSSMFRDCTRLNYIKAMFTTFPGDGAYTDEWVRGVASSGTFVKNAAATWTTIDIYGVPSGWTIVLE